MSEYKIQDINHQYCNDNKIPNNPAHKQRIAMM